MLSTKTFCVICVTILFSMISTAFKILITTYKCISNTRGRSQTETSTSSIIFSHIFAIKYYKNLWITLFEVQLCTFFYYLIFKGESQRNTVYSGQFTVVRKYEYEATFGRLVFVFSCI